MLAFFLVIVNVCCQTDTAKIYNCPQLKAGFYKNYDEFLNNAPSSTLKFQTILFSKNKVDSTIIGAEYKLIDPSATVNDVWGFCDGKTVFVKYSRSVFTKRFWKLEGLGPIPFFTYKEKDIIAAGPGLLKLATIAASASAPAEYISMFVNEKGKFKQFDISRIRQLLKPYAELYKAFRLYTDRYDNVDPGEPESQDVYSQKIKIMKDFIERLNATIINSHQAGLRN